MIVRMFLRGTLTMLIIGAAGTVCAYADPADFRAMPGLWKLETRNVDRGRPAKPAIRWHCVSEEADPWKAFADLGASNEQCRQVDRQRGSTSLSWGLRCRGTPERIGHGRVDFDSPEHYVARVELQGRGEIMHVEGWRVAACTDPSD